MAHDELMVWAVFGLAGGVILSAALIAWRRSKGAMSVFAQDNSLEDIGFTAVSAAFDTTSINRIDGITELRPTWGIRLFAPIIALTLFLFVDLGPFFESIGLNDRRYRSWAVLFVMAVFAYTWCMLLFFQKVTYDDKFIDSAGIDVTSQTRSLKDLVGIRQHEKRPALVLTFAEQKPLYVPKFISQRAKFIADMEIIASHNRENGLAAQKPSLTEKLGF